MKFVYSLVATCALLVVSKAQAQLNLTTAVSELPTCAVACLLQILPGSECGLTNVSCICTSVPIQSDLSSCIQLGCKSTDLDKVSSINGQLCAGYPRESKVVEGIVAALVPGVITLVIVALRCYSRYKIAGRLWWDDWNILGGSLMVIAILAVAVLNYGQMFGEHVWYLNTTQFARLVSQFLAEEMFYTIALTLTRISILCFYLRVFQYRNAFRRIVKGMIVLVTITGMAISLTTVLQCRPLSALWDLSKPRELSCIDLNAFAYSAAGLGIAQDIAIILLPIPELLLLQMDLKKRLNVLFMFGIGSFACITSMIRLKYLISFSYTKDFSWDIRYPSYWSMIEICASIICACLPSVRALLSVWIPSLFRFAHSTKGGSQNSDSSGQSGDLAKRRSGRLSRSDLEARKMEVKVDVSFGAQLEEGKYDHNESTANDVSRDASNAPLPPILKPSVYRQKNPWDAEDLAAEGSKAPSNPVQTTIYSQSRNALPATPLMPPPKHHKNLSWHATQQDNTLWNDRSVLQVPTMSDPQNSSDSDEPDHEPTPKPNPEEKRPTLVSKFSITPDTGVKAIEEEMAILDHKAVEAVRLRAQKVTVVRIRDRRHTLQGAQEAALARGEMGLTKMENRI